MPEQRPLISVIIPVYNVEKYLRQCLDSVAGQTYDNLEVICIDDGSTDSSGAILDEYGTKDQRFKIVHQENRGLSAARNKGLEFVKGDYISFIDSDDWIKPDFYQKLQDAAVCSNADVIQCGYIIWGGDHNKVKETPSKIYYGDDNILKGLRRGYVWNKLWKTSFIQNHNLRFYPKIYLEDLLFSVQASYFITKLQTIKYAGYYYRQNADSITKNKNKKEELKKSIRIICCQALVFAQEHKYSKKNIRKLKSFLVKQIIFDKDCWDNEHYQNLKTILGWSVRLRIEGIKGILRRFSNRINVIKAREE